MDELWKSILAELEIEVSKPVFLTFFRSTKLVSLENNIATISSPTYMTSGYVEQRYYSLIKKVVDKKSGMNVSLVFISEGKKGKAPKDESPGPLFAKDVASLKKVRPQRIRADYTFESLAVSDSNQLAYTAASTVAKHLGSRYNPLFLYGSVGVGKTHLMHAIANKIYNDNPDVSVLYMTTEEFTNEVVEAIMEKTTTQLRKKFRNINLLLLDDIQFLSGKEKVQEELFHTFNTLIDKGSQIVFSSDRPPSEIRKIEARLASRFEGGLSVDISPPDFELRSAILLIKSQKYGMSLSLEAAKMAAQNISDTRALEGFLLRLATVLTGKEDQEITPELVSQIVGKTKKEEAHLQPDIVIRAICNFYNIKPTQLKGDRRDASLVRARHTCMYLLKEDGGLTFVEIGNLLGGRDHTTVMHGVDKVKVMISNPGSTKEEIMLIKQSIKDGFVN